MNTTNRAATSLARFRQNFPRLKKADFEQLLGQPLTKENWQSVEAAYRDYDNRLGNLTASKTSRKKDDPLGWYAQQKAAANAVEAALDKINAARSRCGRFLQEASENYALETHGHSAAGDMSAHKLLGDAQKACCVH